MGGSSHTTETKLSGIDVQTSLLGQPIPIGWGRSRLSCNLIDYVGFKATPHTTKSGGKGGSSTSTTYSYSASVIMALCEGPVIGVRTVYKDSSTLTLSAAKLSLATGTIAQAAWGYMTSQYPTHALGYSSIAYVYAQDYALGDSSASMPNHGFEVDFNIQFGANGDADPRDIVVDYLTNASYGVAGWGSGLIHTATFSDYSTYCRASNLLLSPVLDSQTSGTDFLDRLGKETNSEFFWSEGALKVKPYGDDTATGNSATWTPNLTPEYALDESDFLEEVVVEILDQSDAKNYWKIEYLDRSNQYQPAPASADDLDDIITFGRREGDVEQFHDICDATIARLVAQLRLQRSLYVRRRYTFKLPEDFAALEPMDYVSLTTTVDGVKLSNKLVLIKEINEDQDGNLELTADEVPGRSASSPAYAAHISGGYQPNVDVSPGSVSAPMIFNAPSSITGLDPEVWIAAAGADPNWGGCQVWVSSDNTSYQMVGTITNPAAIGVLTASLADAADPDTTNTCSVDMSASLQALLSASATNAANGATLFMIDDEIMTYQTAALASANHYNLTTLGRGKLGTSHAAHASGAQFARLDEAIFKLAYNALNYGSTMYVKLPSFNIYGRGLEDISTIASHGVNLLSAGVATDWRVQGNTTIGGPLPSAADSTVGDIHIADDGTYYERVPGGIELGGYVVTLAGYRPALYWTIAASQPLRDTIAQADAAWADANSALDDLAGLADDGLLSRNEKITKLIPDSARLEDKWSTLSALAGSLGVSTSAASSARASWLSLLASLSPAWNDTTQDTAVDRTAYDSARDAYDQALYALDQSVKTYVKSLADAAQTTANSAVTAAAAAQSSADAANADLANIASDNVLARVEKPAVILDWNNITAEQSGIDAQAAAYSITTEKTAYDNAVSALSTYLSGLTSPTAWNNTAGDTTITGTTFRTKFGDVYAARQVLLNKIAAVAGTVSTWGGVSGSGKPADNATRNVVTYSSSAPSSPVDGDLWVDTSGTFAVFKLRSGGAWVTGANALTAYNALSGTPVALADINTTESSKLAGIQAGATVGAPSGTNVGSTSASTVESGANAANNGVNSDGSIKDGKVSTPAVIDNAISGFSQASGGGSFTNTSYHTISSVTLTPVSTNTKWLVTISGIITLGDASAAGALAHLFCSGGFDDFYVGQKGVPTAFSLSTVISGLSSALTLTLQVIATASAGSGDPHLVDTASIVALQLTK